MSEATAVPDRAAELLMSEPVMAHVATAVDDRPHVAPVWYWYGDGVVEILTTGQKLANIRRNPRVALSIQKDEGGDTEWTVTLRGTATVIEDQAAIDDAAARINPRYGADEEAWPENVLVRIDVGSASYRVYDDEGIADRGSASR